MTSRMPIVLGWQVEYVATRVTATPEVQRIAGTTEEFVEVISEIPGRIVDGTAGGACAGL